MIDPAAQHAHEPRSYTVIVRLKSKGGGVADTTMAYATLAASAAGCHVMEATVSQEYQQSAHWNTRTGVRPKCADCHVSENLTAAMWDHLVGTRELLSFLFKGIRTPEAFEQVRAEAADRVRLAMLESDSKNCRRCHVMEAIKPQKKRGERQHAEAQEKGITCIACHYNLVHKEVAPSSEFLRRAGVE